jgi:SAM-dependent methyltransferase
MAVGKTTWDQFATEDPQFYIASNRATWDDDAFYASGAAILAHIDRWLPNVRTGHAVEIGAGLGRITAHLARRFDRVDATDVSPRMIEQARAKGLPANITWTQTDGRLPAGDGTVDFVYSFNVMQHVPRLAEIEAYLHEIRRVLRSDGRAAIQYDIHLRPLWQRPVLMLPDPMLPRTARRFIRRYPIALGDLHAMAARAGLDVVEEFDQAPHEHYVLFAPA